MKRTFSKVLFLFAAILLGASPVIAQDYTVDFNTQIETNATQTGTSNRDWKVASGWDHIVDGVEYNSNGDLRYCPYEWQAEAGVDNTGAIYAGVQYYQDYYGDYESFYDLLVSPPIEGVVTIQAKRFNAVGSIGFFKVTKNGDKLVRGEQVFPTTETSNGFTDLTDEWVTYTLPAQPAGTRIGIRLQQGWIDNFTAEGVDLSAQPGLGLTVVSPTVSTTVPATEANTFEVNFEVQVKNTGDLDLTTASDGYNIELRKYVSGGTTQEDHILLATANIPADLAVGETLAQNITLSATLSVDDYPEAATSGISFRIYENVSGSYATTRNITVIPYEAKFDLRQGYSALGDYATLSFGATQEPVSKEVIIRSLGGAPLIIESVDVPEGYSTTLAPKTIAPLTNDTITITLDAATPGHKEGAFVIHTNAGYKTLNLSGTVIGADDYFVDFSAASLEGIMLENNGSGYYTYGWTAPYTTYSITNEEKARGYATSSSTPGPFKLILPKLKFEEGDVLQFDAQKASSYNDANLTILYSADRNEWTQLRRLAHDAEREADKLTLNEASYVLQNIPAGEWYIAFEITYESEVLLDNIVGGKPVEVKHDLVLNATVPETGSVNKPFNARATVRNLIATEEAGSYTARLYFDDEVQKEAEAVALTTGQDVNFSFAFTPHTAGTYQARIELAFADGEIVASAPVSVTIEEEVYSAMKQIGAGDKSESYNPLHGYYNKTKAENLYTAEELAAEGITAGTKISQIAFLGYNTQRDQDYPAKVWIAEQEADEFASASEGSGIVEGTPVFDGTVTLLKDGASGAYAQILTFDLPEQYIYQGGNLVIATQLDGSTYLGSSAVAWAASSTDDKLQAIHRYNDSSLAGEYSETMAKPVVLLGIEAEAKTVSGKVTDKSTGAAMADVTVTATSGEVVYSGKTNAEGNYEFAILQDALEYQLSTDAEGYFPVNKTVSVKLESQVVNLELMPARGIFIDEFVMAQTGMVNYPVSATVKASNYTAADFAAGAYTAKLYVAGEAVSQAEAVELKAGDTKEFQFSFTPHAEGTFAAYVEFAEGDNVTTSDEAEVTIGEELVGGDMVIGETTERTYYSPINLYYNNSVADIVYTPEMLTAFGVLPGNQITSIKLTAQSESPKTLTAELNAWVGSINYDAETFVPGAGRDDLQQVKTAEELPIDLTGASSTSPIVWDITFDLPEPIVFDGTNSVRLMVDKYADGYVSYTYFGLDQNYTTAWVQYYDGADQRESMWANLSTSNKESYCKVPVATFSVAGGVTVSGTVKNEAGEAVAGASVVAQSGDVIYEATTDAMGAYTLDVKQASLEYTITVTAEGYKAATAEVAPNNADAEQDFVLEVDSTTGISSLAADRRNGAVYNLQGQRVDGVRKGLYINGGKKVVVK